MRFFCILLLVISNSVFACGKEIPIEVRWEFNKKPTATKFGTLMILAPIKYKGWSLNGVQLDKEKNSISIKEYVSEEEFPGNALFQIRVTSEFLNGTKFTASYTPDPIEQTDGSFYFAMCLHIQNIEVKI